MKRKLFSALLFGACLMASTSTFVSCKDYDDDIANLQTQIDANSKAIAEIQKLIQSGSVITNVSSTENGVTVTLSNGNSFNVTNGKDGAPGKDGSVVTIGDNGNWFIDGKDTGKAAQGPKGDKGDQGEKGDAGTAGADAAVTGEWYALSGDCTTLEYYKDGVKDASKNIVIADLIKNAGVVNAVKTDDVLVLYNLGDKENPIAIISLRTEITALALWEQYSDIHADEKKCNNVVTFTYAIQKANTFPAESGRVDGSLTFADKNFATDVDKSIIVRVTPANATLKASEITLIDSKGADLSDFVECVAAEPYDAPLFTRSTASANGLYQLTLKLKDGYDADAFAKATHAKDGKYDKEGNNVIFAVAVNEKSETANRLVTSEWDVTVKTEKAKPVLDFTVNSISINKIHNRYEQCEDKSSTKKIKELVWLDNNKPAVAPIVGSTDAKNPDNAADRYKDYDNRQNTTNCPILPVTVGQDITIDFSYDEIKNAEGGNIAGFYVALDHAFALESAPSELAAWTKYSYEGVTVIGDGGVEKKGTLFKGNKGTIKITSLNGSNPYDIIGFRVYAVNADGTLYDPDGRAFYVGVGEEKGANTIEGTILANKAIAESDFIPVDGIFTNNTYGDWTAVKFKDNGQEINQTFKLKYYKEDKKAEIEESALKTSGADVKYVKFEITSNEFIDGATYTQTIEVTKEQNGVKYPVKTITAIMTKKMPTEFPKTFAFRPMQEIDGIEGTGIFKSYLRPQFEKTPTPMVKEYAIQTKIVEGKTVFAPVLTGWTNFNDVFYGLDGDYKFEVANVVADKDGKFTVPVEVKATKDKTNPYEYKLSDVSAADELMDDVTKHDIAATYLYRKCSYKWVTDKDGKNGKHVAGDYEVPYGKNLQVIFSCWHYAESYSFASGKAPQLQWTQTGEAAYTHLEDILAKSSYNDAFFGGNLDKIVNTNSWLAISKIELYYGDQLNPYFTPEIGSHTYDVPVLDKDGKQEKNEDGTLKTKSVTKSSIVFKQKDTQVDHNPTADHVEKLKITFKDSYGHEHPYTLDVTVKKAAAAN